jgi:hypothetical protein
MAVELPEVSGTSDGRGGLTENGHLIFRLGGRRRGALARVVQDYLDLGEGEAGELDIELDIDQGLQLDREHVAIPAGVLGELVVRDDVGPALSRAEVGQTKGWNALDSEELCGFDPAVTGDDLIVVADQHRVREPEALDAAGDLLDLLLRVGGGVGSVRAQARDALGLNGHGLHGRSPIGHGRAIRGAG